MQKKFNKEDLIGTLWEEDNIDLRLVETKLVDTSRWSLLYRMVFEDLTDERLYMTHYSVGATEQQDESPFQYDDDEIMCTEVEEVQVTVTDYKVV